jgi:outer membrane protein assembly factor BamB
MSRGGLPVGKLLVTFFCAVFAVQSAYAFPEKKRPFRLGVIRLNKNLDTVKPLAETDTGGFAARGDVFIGGLDSNWIRAYNMSTKITLWWQQTDGEITSPPLLIENTVYVSSRSGKLTALNATTGERLWETLLDAHIERPMTWANGNIYAVSAGQVAYAIEASSGKRLWVHDAGFPDMVVLRRAPAPVIHDGRMIFGLATGELLALKIEDGKRLWRYNPFYQEARFKDVIGDMIVHGGKLLVSRYDGLVALVDMTQERQVIWQDRQTSVSTSAFRSGRYFVGLTNGTIIAYEANTGRVNWKVSTGPTPAFLVASESVLYAIGNSGRVTAIDIGSGEYQWGDDLGGRVSVPPIVTSDRMYIATGLKNLYGYRIQ